MSIQKDQEEFLKALADHNDGKVVICRGVAVAARSQERFPKTVTTPLPWSCSVNRTRTSRNAWSTTTESAADYRLGEILPMHGRQADVKHASEISYTW